VCVSTSCVCVCVSECVKYVHIFHFMYGTLAGAYEGGILYTHTHITCVTSLFILVVFLSVDRSNTQGFGFSFECVCVFNRDFLILLVTYMYEYIYVYIVYSFSGFLLFPVTGLGLCSLFLVTKRRRCKDPYVYAEKNYFLLYSYM